MPWVVGIDEAGYGPNLGPLVQAAVAVRLPDDDPAGWATMRAAVRRCHDPADDRLLIDDSKKVYAGANGLAKLELGVLAGLILFDSEFAAVVRKTVLPAACDELAREAWYAPDAAVPLTDCPCVVTEHGRVGERLTGTGVLIPLPDAVVVPAPRFNRLVDAFGSKGVVLADGLVQLLAAAVRDLPAGDPVHVVCDKHGGRNRYGPMLAAAFPDGWVVAERESAAESRYRIVNVGRDVTVLFRPRADGDSVAVALASMLCKYLREVCMAQFNAFWARHVPGIRPTAGYPVDARRFFAEIRPAMAKLDIPDDAVWRKK